MTIQSGIRRLAAPAWWLAIAVLIAYVLHVTVELGGPQSFEFFADYVYNGLIAFAALACIGRAIAVREERAAWTWFGIALSSWLASELYFTLRLSHLAITPFPSVSDAFFVAFYPAAFAGLFSLVRGRVRAIGVALLIDGVIAALAACAVGASLTFGPALIAIADSAGTLPLIFNLAYPIGDLVLLGAVAGALSLTGWNPGPALAALAVGLLLVTIADGVFLVQTMNGTYIEGLWLDALWPTGLLLVGWAACRPVGHVQLSATGKRALALPIIFSLASVAVLTAALLLNVNRVALALATATVLAVVLRMAWSLRDNIRLLDATREEALTDPLTGLANRRSLALDLSRALAEPTDTERRHLLALFDLDGFKGYNDAYGHPAGDALLVRRAKALLAAVDGNGTAYRLGGDEFCVLLESTAGTGTDALLAAAATALSERSADYEIKASWGAVELPGEAAEPTLALAIADQRMYQRKSARRASPRHQSTSVLRGVMNEREGDLHLHSSGVAELAGRVGRRLGMPLEEVEELVRAAELHDIGKIGISELILDKPTPLSETEWQRMREHTVMGERILRRAPALVPVAGLVRSSHERWDGTGYPDGLAGEAIPLGARIVAVCDAFDAMTANRPYRSARSIEDALGELRRCAGSQFDPAVVDAFCQVLGGAHRDRAGAEHVADAPEFVITLADAPARQSDVMAPEQRPAAR
jgi:two-component system cell cycle response regulator